MKKLLTATVAALAMLATVPTAHAAKFWTEPGTCFDSSKTCIDLHMQGEIVKGDNARFNKAVAKVPKGKATIYLDSMGGLFEEGFPIAKTVRRQNWNTYVDKFCGSMCAIIWLAGNVRYLRRTAGVGFHGISMAAPKGSTAGIIWRGKRVVRHAVDNALVLKFFQEIGISAKTGRILLAPDINHRTVVSVYESMDLKLAPWPKEDVVTVPASLAQRVEPAPSPAMPAPAPQVVANATPAPQRAASAPPLPQASTSPQQPAPQTATAPLISQPSRASEQPVAPMAQRVVLYDEDQSDPKGKQYVGSVVWRTEPIKTSGNQQADIAVRADIDIPDKFKMTMSFRRNTDTSLPASHTVQLTFILPPEVVEAPKEAASSEGRFLVFLSSQSTEAEAQGLVLGDAERVSRPDRLALARHQAVRRKDGVHYRATVGPFASREEATRFCVNYMGDCFVNRVAPQGQIFPRFSGGSVANVPGILTKSNEQARGTPLAGLAVKVTDAFFLVGLSNVDADRSRNIQLLKERSWFDVPLVYTNQRRAIISIEKGAPGERAFKDALTAWGEDYPTASTASQPVGQPPAQSDTAQSANSPLSGLVAPVDINANSGWPRVVFPPLNQNANPPPAAPAPMAAPQRLAQAALALTPARKTNGTRRYPTPGQETFGR